MRASILIPSVLVGAAIVAAGTLWADAASHRTVAGHPASLGAVGAVTDPPTSAPSTPATSRHPAPKPSSTVTSTHAAGGGAQAVRRAAVPYRAPAKPKSAAHGSCAAVSAGGASSIELAVFTMLNQERAANGMCPMQWSSLLQKSARGHSTLMDQKSSAADCSDGNYSHDYSGEPAIDTRIFATGYRRGPVAEAIGCSPDPTTRGALTLQEMMYNEKPPANQHREMILSTIVTHVGIAIVIDPSDNTLWLTEDYGS